MMNKLLDRLYEWMQSFIPFVGVTLLLLSCRSQQPMTLSENTESDRQTVTNRNENTDRSSVLQQDIDMFTEQWAQKIQQLSGSWIYTVYSKPDSTGQQYVESVTTGTFENRTDEQQRDSSYTRHNAEALEIQTNTTSQNTTEKVQEVKQLDAERKANISWWQAVLIFLGVVGVVIITIKLIWRKRP